MEKVLVTGGAGFIGSHVVDRCISEGYEVAIIDNLSTGFRKNLNPKATFYEVDIRDFEKVKMVFEKEKPDYVNHHAAQMDVRKSTQDPVFDAECNIIGSLNLILNSVEFKIKKLIYISTGGAVYGEPQDLPVTEEYPLNPLCQYGVSKHTVEHYLYLYRRNFDMNYTVLRYPNVYGPRQNPHGEAGVIAIFLGLMLDGERPTIFGDGTQTRDYTFIEDIVDANLIAMTKEDGEIYNIGTGVETSVRQIFDSIEAILQTGLEPIYADERVGEIQSISLDATKAKEEIGWFPKHDFLSGLKKTIKYYQKVA